MLRGALTTLPTAQGIYANPLAPWKALKALEGCTALDRGRAIAVGDLPLSGASGKARPLCGRLGARRAREPHCRTEILCEIGAPATLENPGDELARILRVSTMHERVHELSWLLKKALGKGAR